MLYSETSETDRYSELIYDFRKILKNQQILFPISQVYINVCRNPEKLDESCPLEIRGKKVYDENPSLEFRKKLIKKYFFQLYNEIDRFKGKIILSGHTTIGGHSSLDKELSHQIVLSNIMKHDDKITKVAPDKLLEAYAEELEKRLPEVKIGINSVYTEVYDYLFEKKVWSRNIKDTALIHQETDESLYIDKNKVNLKKVNRLKKAFAESLLETIKKFY